jgi:signal peptidase
MRALLSSDRVIAFLRSWTGWVALLGCTLLFWPSVLGGRVDYVLVSGTSMEPTMHTGDLVLVRAHDHYEPGQTIAYRIPEGDIGAGSWVIHRVVGGDGESGYIVQGDNRDVADDWHPTDADVVGAQWAMVPGAGRWMAAFRSPAAVGILVGVLVLALILWPSEAKAPAGSPRPGRSRSEGRRRGPRASGVAVERAR